MFIKNYDITTPKASLSERKASSSFLEESRLTFTEQAIPQLQQNLMPAVELAALTYFSPLAATVVGTVAIVKSIPELTKEIGTMGLSQTIIKEGPTLLLYGSLSKMAGKGGGIIDKNVKSVLSDTSFNLDYTKNDYSIF